MRREQVERSLSAALRGLREETSGAAAPERVRETLRRAVRAQRRPAAAWWRAAIAAALLIGAGMTLQRWLDCGSGAAGQQAFQAAVWLPPEAGEDAVSPWFYHAGLPAPRSAQVVRIPVAPETARKFGVVRPPASLEAEVLIGDDGLARAIRFVRDIDSNRIQSKETN
jgi:hypothetical protein